MSNSIFYLINIIIVRDFKVGNKAEKDLIYCHGSLFKVPPDWRKKMPPTILRITYTYFNKKVQFKVALRLILSNVVIFYTKFQDILSDGSNVPLARNCASRSRL